MVPKIMMRIMRKNTPEYSLRLKPRSSGLAATLSIHRWSLVAILPDLRADGLCPSYKSGVRRYLPRHSPIVMSLSGDGFSRTTHARIRTLLDRYPTTRATCLLARYSPVLFGARKTRNSRDVCSYPSLALKRRVFRCILGNEGLALLLEACYTKCVIIVGVHRYCLRT
jgi:hypothetical protein